MRCASVLTPQTSGPAYFGCVSEICFDGSSMRVCFDSLCFASDRLAEDGDDEDCQVVAMSNGKVITSEGKFVRFWSKWVEGTQEFLLLCCLKKTHIKYRYINNKFDTVAYIVFANMFNA